MVNLKAARDALGSRASLDKVVVGTPLTMPALRAFRQPHEAQFVIYSVPDDVAAAFDCESQLTLGDPKQVKRAYGNYFGATFTVDGRPDDPVALLWAKEDGYWKIVSWKVGADDARTPAPEPVAGPPLRPHQRRSHAGSGGTGIPRKLADQEELRRGVRLPVAEGLCVLRPGTRPGEARGDIAGGCRAQAACGPRSGGAALGASRSLEALLSAPEPLHPAVRVMNHSFSKSLRPDQRAECARGCGGVCRPRGAQPRCRIRCRWSTGLASAMNIRFKTRSGDAPVLRMLWRKENDAWRITSYMIEMP